MIKVLQLSDTHIFGDTSKRLLDLDTEQSFLQVLEAVRRDKSWPPDMVIATGDLSHDGSDASYKKLVQYFESLRVPVHGLPGNHDDPAALARRLVGKNVGAPPEIVVDHWLFLLLDSTIPNQTGGALNSKELSRLEAALKKNPKKNVLLSFHHHPIKIGSEWMDTMVMKNGEEFLRVVDNHPNVKGIVWGHIHQAYESRRNGTLLLGSPSTSIQFKPKSATFALDPTPPGYRWLELHDDGRIETRVERVPNYAADLDFSAKGY